MSDQNTAPISKRLRFQIFERDRFTCQYCGKQPPEVMLHVDHIIARSKGGTNDPENLRTSCVACNLGKSDKPIGVEANEKDGLRRIQESLEATNTAEVFVAARQAREKLRQDVCNYICNCLHQEQCKQESIGSLVNAIDRHGAESVMKWFEFACDRTGRYSERKAMMYFHGILRRTRERQEAGI